MDFYFDEQLPPSIAEALNLIEGHEKKHRVFSTASVFGKGVQDIDLFRKLQEVNGILVTHDLKMLTRRKEFELIKDLGISVFVISLPDGANYELIYRTIIGDKWHEIKALWKKRRNESFVCRIKMRGDHDFY